MKAFRFDAELAVPDRIGSPVRKGRLTDDTSRVRVEVWHFGAGGHAAHRLTPDRRFLGVVAGSGWAAAEGERRALRSGSGVMWEPGEVCRAGSDDGMTAIVIEGEFEPAATAITQEIVVSDYNADWPEWFERLSERVWPAVASIALRIDHVGSTSVPGLAAKPVIDMDVVLRSPEDLPDAIEGLGSIGYEWLGDLGVSGREAFRPPPEGVDPRHHLYVVVEDNKAHLDHWLLRDLLRGDPRARQRYADLKRRNRDLAGGDMDFYLAAKAPLVAELLTRARAERGLPSAAYWQPE